MKGFLRLAGLGVLIGTTVGVGMGRAQDAETLEDQYKTCAKHYIPADKCTLEIYGQLKAKDNAPLDPNVTLALEAVKMVVSPTASNRAPDNHGFINPDTVQVRVAYVIEPGTNGKTGMKQVHRGMSKNYPTVCLELGGQNPLGGTAVQRYAVWKNTNEKHPEKEHMNSMQLSHSALDGGLSWWPECAAGGFSGKLAPGADVTEQVQKVLKDGR